MGKFYTFLLGLAAGFCLHHVAASQHIVRTESGLHLTPKAGLSLQDTYVDIRGFSPSDWADHPQLAAAIARSDSEELKREAVSGAVEQLLPAASGD